MRNSPVKQISEGQRIAPQLPIEPDAKVMQGDFGSQACLKAIQGLGTLTSEPKAIEQFVIDGLNDLPQPGQPASPVFGPADLTALMWWADDLGAVSSLPVLMQLISCEAFVGDIDAPPREHQR